MTELIAKKPFYLPAILLSSLLVSAFIPGASRTKTFTPKAQPMLSLEVLQPVGFSSSGDLRAFIHSVVNGQAQQIVGVYVPGEFSHPVIQQPQNDPVFVSTTPDEVTQFEMPAKFGAVGLLAHNSLAGLDFFKLGLGSTFYLVYGSGMLQRFTVQNIRRFQALDPENPYSDFLEAGSKALPITSADLFNEIYSHAGEVVFQTCIDQDGNSSWGRIFITAVPQPLLPELTPPLQELAYSRN